MNEEYKCSGCNGTGNAHYYCYTDDDGDNLCTCYFGVKECCFSERHAKCKLTEAFLKRVCTYCDGTGKVDWLTNIFHNNYKKPKLVVYKQNIIDLKEKNRCTF